MTRACGAECDNCGFEVDQPEDEWWLMPDGLFVKKLLIAKAGTYVPQHAHASDHVTWLRVGIIRVWVNNVFRGVRAAPCSICVKAGIKHTFQSLRDNTEMYCIHKLKGESYPAVTEEHQFEGVA
jgi:hypothetical protein